MDGIIVNRKDVVGLTVDSASSKLSLLAQQNEVEIMNQTLKADDVVWLIPADDKDAMEFFFIHKGAVELMLDDGPIPLGVGESFYVQALEKEILLKTQEATELLYITNRPMFASVFGFQDDLKKLLVRINDKDHYTYRHSGNVMHYSMKLFESLPDACTDVSLDDIVVASLFHDVGKCFVPDEILKKTSELTRSEARFIIRHPLDSARLLRPHFGERIAEIANNHHERLDGSGYPMGLTAEDISMPAKIVAVADVFDAMTTDRGYNTVKTFEDAAAELYELNDQFDRRVTSALIGLIETGALNDAKEKIL